MPETCQYNAIELEENKNTFLRPELKSINLVPWKFIDWPWHMDITLFYQFSVIIIN